MELRKEGVNYCLRDEQFNDINISLTTLHEILHLICKEGSALLNSRACILRLITLDGKLLINAFNGLDEKAIDFTPLTLGKGLIGKVAKEGEPFLIEDLSRIPYEPGIPYRMNPKSSLVIPLKFRGNIIGTMDFFDKLSEHGAGSFNQNDISNINRFASLSAVAIGNTRYFEYKIKKEKIIEQKDLKHCREVTQTKEYLESIIENSPDAIITLDLKGNVMSWNKGAEVIYGYSENETFSRPLKIIPKHLIDSETKKLEEAEDKGVIKDRVTIRKRKNGDLIEISITESPILSPSGELIGFCTISRDITEKKRVEDELRRRNQELSKLFFISSAMRSTLEMGKILRMTLTAVTMEDGLGFNRAILFFVDEETNTLRGKLGIGPINSEQAYQIRKNLAKESLTLEDLMHDTDPGKYIEKESPFNKLCQEIIVDLRKHSIFASVVKKNKPFNIIDAKAEPLVDAVLVQKLNTEAFAVVPLISRGKTRGILWVDNFFTKKPITEEDLKFLIGFADNIASSIENARLFEQESLAQAELKNIFESISDMVYFTDKKYNIKQINQAVIDKIKKPSEEIIGKKCFEVFHKTDVPWLKCPHHKTINTGKSYIEEIKDPAMKGTFIVSSSPIFSGTGELIGTVHISRDVTEFQEMREKLATAERKAALGDMAAQVAHEIRNPLTPIGGFARQLEKRLKGEMQDYARIIVEEVNRLEGILKDILSFVKEAKLEKGDIDLNILLEDAINLLNKEVVKKGNKIIKELTKEPVITKVDSNRIKEAILNILYNANQGTKDGIIIVTLKVHLKKAIITIEDNGYGIQEKHMEKIFDPFFTTTVKGTGLGLAITNRIIEEHQGSIEVKSKWGEGTRFKIYLPLKEV